MRFGKITDTSGLRTCSNGEGEYINDFHERNVCWHAKAKAANHGPLNARVGVKQA